MTRLHAALLMTSIMVVGAFVLATAPTPTEGLFVDSKTNTANTFTVGGLLPATGLSATPFDATTVDLSWTASATAYASGYTVLRSLVSGAGYAAIGSTVGHGSTSYTDLTAVTATTYYYVIQATYQSWTAVGSNEATATTP
jgi:hypothetical protein